ncbi:MAG: hypothetical protein ACF8NJ_07335, partial [Phycisphaerales bacterium JB038]
MDETALANLPVPLCPRCGYDLRGTAFAWEEVCPLEGICPDCGHEFAWVNVFRRRRHPSLLEHQWRRLSIPALARRIADARGPDRLWRRVRGKGQVWLLPLLILLVLSYALALVAAWAAAVSTAALWTMVSTLRPSLFWRSVRMEHRVNLWLVAAAPVLTWVLLLFCAWVAALSADVWDWWSTNMARPDYLEYAAAAARITGHTASEFVSERLAVWLTPALVPLAMPLLFLTLPKAHIRFVHLLRIAAYSLVGVAMLVLVLIYASTLADELSDLRLLPGQTEDAVPRPGRGVAHRPPHRVFRLPGQQAQVRQFIRQGAGV